MRIKQIKPTYFIAMTFLTIAVVAFTGNAWGKGAIPPTKKDFCVTNNLKNPLYANCDRFTSPCRKGHDDMRLKFSAERAGKGIVWGLDVWPGQTKCIDTTNLGTYKQTIYYNTEFSDWRKMTYHPGVDKHRCDFSFTLYGDGAGNFSWDEKNCD